MRAMKTVSLVFRPTTKGPCLLKYPWFYLPLLRILEGRCIVGSCSADRINELSVAR